LLKCKECGLEISNGVKSCPECGMIIAVSSPKDAAFTLILVCSCIVIVIALFRAVQDPPSDSTLEPKQQKTLGENLIAVRYDTGRMRLEREIKKNLEEPEIYEHINTNHMVAGDVMYIETTYFVRNGVDAELPRQAILEVGVYDGSMKLLVSD